MKKMINYGIDLGTSNSLIARCTSGSVEIFKNPRGHKETLPSIVGFKKDKILVGDKAKEFIEKNPRNVIGRFKTKMGTSETIKIDSINSSKTPVELSSIVLKELKGFIHSGEDVDSAVITIPAAFDTIQSNATKEAGIEAGFKDVILLQEPIAASLAYANKDNSEALLNSQWIVYDLGGGTFDVALVKIIEGELSVVDHEGDNFFGGSDLDLLMLEKIIVPKIEASGEFTNLLSEMKSASGRYNKEWFRLLHDTENAKIDLSSDLSAEIDVELEDESGKEIELTITITRSEFEELIKEKIIETTQMMKKMLTRHSLQPKDIKFVLMVGGSTYIPFVRKYVEEVMGISVNTDIDPTTAIGVGAAFFAGTKQKSLEDTIRPNKTAHNLKVRVVYERNSQEDEEMFSAKIEGDIDNMTYRIYSGDGAYDSGNKKLKSRITEDLPLRKGEFNLFQFEIRDGKGNSVETGIDQIQITQGRYSIAGQMLPEDICLVKDDLKNKDTRLDRIFEKNCVLPTRKGGVVVEVGKTIKKESEDKILIMIVEGASANHHMSNKPIGTLEISGQMINRDLLKGTEIDLTFEMSESRDLTTTAYLNGTGQEFSQVFNPKSREVKLNNLSRDILKLEEVILKEQEEAAEKQNHDTEKRLNKVLGDVQLLIMNSGSLPEDDVTNQRYQLEDKKRALAKEVYQLTSNKRIENALSEYNETKESVIKLLQEYGSEHEKNQVSEIVGREEVFLKSKDLQRIEIETNGLYSVRFNILMRVPGYLVSMFEYSVENRVSLNDQNQANQLIENGKQFIEEEDWEGLRMVIERLWDLIPETEKESYEYRMITGIV